MCNLLSANLLRLKKSVLFWGALILSFGFGVWVTVVQVVEQLKYGGFPDSPAFSRYAVLIGVVIAVFISLFFGTEYSDGTIRNKIITGRPRASIYLANLVTGAVCALLFCAAYFAACLGISAPFVSSGVLRELEIPPAMFVLTIVGILALALAYTGLFLLVTMNCSRKTVSSVICILVSCLLLVLGIYLEGRLEAPEYISGYSFSVNGQLVQDEPELNPRYLRGMERDVYQFLYDFTPGGQSTQYAMAAGGNLEIMPVYSLVILLTASAAGAALFRRKDLK